MRRAWSIRRQGRRARSALTLGGECSAHGRGDLTRHGRGRALFADKDKAIPFVGPLLGRPAVAGGPICERARPHREHATGAKRKNGAA